MVILMQLNSYTIVIIASLIVIFSYFANLISKKTNIPSVLLLIVLGILIKFGMDRFELTWLQRDTESLLLEVLGKVGLIFIVLEAALDLELTRDKLGIISKAFIVALIGLVLSSFAIAFILDSLLIHDFIKSLVYAIPLSIMSSAIIIPSVMELEEKDKEFMIYESTFSDILGIMFFYILLRNVHTTEVAAPISDAINVSGKSVGEILKNVATTIGLTLLFSVIFSYALTYLLQRINSHLKLFLTISILLLIYALGSMYHLSPLVLILAFGLMLNNSKMFWKGPLKGLLDHEKLRKTTHDFHILTLETAFIVRTFFFVIFGITISLASIVDPQVVMYSVAIVAALYLVRFIILFLFNKKSISPLLYIAPRGLITILLFFQIQSAFPQFVAPEFNQGILLFVIISSSLIMTFSLIRNGLKPRYSVGEMEAQKIEDYLNHVYGDDLIEEAPNKDDSQDNKE